MKPILFNTEMVRAILDGRKTQTRRVCKGQPQDDITSPETLGYKPPYRPGDVLYVRETWNYGYIETSDNPGVYDAWFEDWDYRTAANHTYLAALSRFWYKADNDDLGDVAMSWRPSIHMPREAARLFLRVTDVWAERLQESFNAPTAPILAVQAEGIDIGDTCRDCIFTYGNPCCVDDCDDDSTLGECGMLDENRGAFADLWDSTIKPADRKRYGWDENPWVWVICFERCEKPEEAI